MSTVVATIIVIVCAIAFIITVCLDEDDWP